MNDPSESIDYADDELVRKVCLYLTHTGHRPVKTIEVEARDGVITLRGRVPSYYARQLAIACVQRVAGVRRVIDQIDATTPASVQVPQIPRQSFHQGALS